MGEWRYSTMHSKPWVTSLMFWLLNPPGANPCYELIFKQILKKLCCWCRLIDCVGSCVDCNESLALMSWLILFNCHYLKKVCPISSCDIASKMLILFIFCSKFVQTKQFFIMVSIVTNSCTYLLKNTLKSHKIPSPQHVLDHTGIHPQGAITRSWLKYLQVHGASPYSRYCGCIGELQYENMHPLRRQIIFIQPSDNSK